MKIVISGYYGSNNAGDEAMLDAMLDVLRDFAPNIRVTVISVNPDDTKLRHNVNSVRWLDIFAIAKEVVSADLLISGGGSLLQNVTSRRSLYYYLGIISLAMLLGCPVMLYAQGFGPIRGSLARWCTRLIINRVNLVTVRDLGSLNELKLLNIVKPPTFCTADPVLAMKPVSTDIGRRILHRYGEDKFIGDRRTPLIGIAARHWLNWQHCQSELAKALDSIAQNLNARIIFLPMQFDDDIKASRSIADLSATSCTIIEGQHSTAEWLSLVGCMDILIGIRLHALIFAAVMNVPMIGISYDPKINRFLNSIGESPVATLCDVSADNIVAAVEHRLLNPSVRDVSNLRAAAQLNASLAIDLIAHSR